MNEPGGRGAPWLLAIVTVAALALRLVGIGELLPHRTEADTYLIPQSRLFRLGVEVDYDSQPMMSRYPHLLARGLALLPLGPLPAPTPAGATPEEILATHLDAAAAEHRRGRIVIAVLSSAIVPLTYLLARFWLGPWASLFAALLAATSLLHVNFSQQIRPHGALASFVALAVLADLHLQRRGTWSRLLLASGATALAVGCLQNGLAVVIPGAVALLLREGAARGARRWLGQTLAMLAVPVAAVLGALWLFYPFARSSGVGGLSASGDGVEQGGHVVKSAWITLEGFGELLAHMLSYDPVLLVLAALGAGVGLVALVRERAALRRSWRPLCVTLAFPLPYVVVIGLLLITPERYLMPVIPFLAILGGYGAARLAAPLARRPALVAAAAVLVLALPAWAATRLVASRAAPDTLTEAARWLVEHAPDRDVAIVASPGLALPLFQTPPALNATRYYTRTWLQPWHQYQALLERPLLSEHGWNVMPLARDLGAVEGTGDRDALPSTPHDVMKIVETVGARLAVVVSAAYRRDPAPETFAAIGTEVARFAASDDGLALGRSAGFQSSRSMLRRALLACRAGPEVVIYELPE